MSDAFWNGLLAAASGLLGAAGTWWQMRRQSDREDRKVAVEELTTLIGELKKEMADRRQRHEQDMEDLKQEQTSVRAKVEDCEKRHDDCERRVADLGQELANLKYVVARNSKNGS